MCPKLLSKRDAVCNIKCAQKRAMLTVSQFLTRNRLVKQHFQVTLQRILESVAHNSLQQNKKYQHQNFEANICHEWNRKKYFKFIVLNLISQRQNKNDSYSLLTRIKCFCDLSICTL